MHLSTSRTRTVKQLQLGLSRQGGGWKHKGPARSTAQATPAASPSTKASKPVKQGALESTGLQRGRKRQSTELGTWPVCACLLRPGRLGLEDDSAYLRGSQSPTPCAHPLTLPQKAEKRERQSAGRGRSAPRLLARDHSAATHRRFQPYEHKSHTEFLANFTCILKALNTKPQCPNSSRADTSMHNQTVCACGYQKEKFLFSMLLVLT